MTCSKSLGTDRGIGLYAGTDGKGYTLPPLDSIDLDWIRERNGMMKKIMSLVVLLTMAAAWPAMADTPIGLRAGLTDWGQLNQFHVGADFRLGEILPNIEFTPNVELGLGDDATNVVRIAEESTQGGAQVQ